MKINEIEQLKPFIDSDIDNYVATIDCKLDEEDIKLYYENIDVHKIDQGKLFVISSKILLKMNGLDDNVFALKLIENKSVDNYIKKQVCGFLRVSLPEQALSPTSRPNTNTEDSTGLLLLSFFLAVVILPGALKFLLYEIIAKQIKSMALAIVLICITNISVIGVFCYATTFITKNDAYQFYLSLCAIAFLMPAICQSSWLDIFKIISPNYASFLCFFMPATCFITLYCTVEPTVQIKQQISALLTQCTGQQSQSQGEGLGQCQS